MLEECLEGVKYHLLVIMRCYHWLWCTEHIKAWEGPQYLLIVFLKEVLSTEHYDLGNSL